MSITILRQALALQGITAVGIGLHTGTVQFLLMFPRGEGGGVLEASTIPMCGSCFKQEISNKGPVPFVPAVVRAIHHVQLAINTRNRPDTYMSRSCSNYLTVKERAPPSVVDSSACYRCPPMINYQVLTKTNTLSPHSPLPRHSK